MLMCTFTRNINAFGAVIKISMPKLVNNDFSGIYFTSTHKNHVCVKQKGMVMHTSKEAVNQKRFCNRHINIDVLKTEKAELKTISISSHFASNSSFLLSKYLFIVYRVKSLKKV
jgi:hypothetical protein